MFFVWFLFFFFFFFFLRKESEKLGKQETQRCPCSLVKALRSHLEMLLAVGRQMGTELCRLVLCMDVLVCGNPARSHLLMCKNFPDKL